MGDFTPLHPDKPGPIAPRDITTRHYRAIAACGPFSEGTLFSAWPWGEVYAWISGPPSGPICKNSDIADWLKAGQIELVT